MGRVRLLHVITGLATAGAETALRQLAGRLDRSRYDIRVITLRADPGAVAAFARETGWPVDSLGMRGPLDAPRALNALRREVRAFSPDILQSWLYHADLLSALARSAAPRAQLVWSLRNASLAPEGRLDWALLTRVLARVSGSVDLVIANADAALRDHFALGYRPRATAVIPNGWTVSTAPPSPLEDAARARTRRALGLAESEVAILLPARFAAQKDYATYCAAARHAHARLPSLRFLAAGQGATPDALRQLDRNSPVEGLGERTDVQALMTAVDAVTLTSAYGEGCPNGLGEAMALGVPVIATANGGVPALVGDAGALVPARDPVRLSEAFLAFAGLTAPERAARGMAARARIETSFSFERTLADHEALYQGLIAARREADVARS